MRPMARHRSFTAVDVDTVVDDDPVSFDLAGRKLFCLPAMPAAARSLIRGRVELRDCIVFIESVLTEDSVAMFRDALADKHQIVDQDVLVDVAEWLIGEYAARPTRRPSGSSDGRPSTTGTSTAA